ncbi:GNAT family N-acetyltransferase [Chitinophaga qingshengii]|uniref:GNAT family N-acetyltransferase n=1 Tax=Chitinophaga qingshengii TaxID=1569794 RepID=A0ABR7TQK0_9BACT|nr:GNAT family N-acetyltransferase [Chitinophaga qingshengii]MBC9932764.1 GNAT family N-acetyltransferase [Chitinophaga qingshengii]
MDTVLQNATPRQLEAAIAENHRALFRLDARLRNGVVHDEAGICWTYIPATDSGALLFPAITVTRLDEIMDFYRAHPNRGLECWSLDPAETPDLDVLLLARGFQTGWKPCWMALDLHAIHTGYTSPEGLSVLPDNDTDLEGIGNLPYANKDTRASTAIGRQNTGTAQRFVATLNGNIVAQTLMIFGGGVAGIYNVGVVPEARGKGVGKAIVSAACSYAQEKGYHYATLNANPMGRPVYEQLGFQWLGDGLTWWITDDRLTTRPPARDQIALAEATGKGDIAALERFAGTDLNAPLCNGMRLIELAVHCRQPAAAEWLIAHGADYGALHAWDLGWKHRTAEMLKKVPEEVNRLYEAFQYTLLHIAVQRNDMALAELVLAAGPDLTIRDAIHDSSAEGWADFFDRKEIIALIKAYQNNPSK